MTNKFHLSFEFFPPRSESAEVSLQHCWRELALLKPDFFSVTFGAGGATREKTQETVYQIMRGSQLPAAPHISCMGSTRENILTLIKDYHTKGIKHLVVLRGDFPSGMIGSPGEFRHANDLVKFIRAETADHFMLYVAGYPEAHPEAVSIKTDVDYLAKKVANGANGIFTQYFFNLDAFLAFRELCDQHRIHVPIIPGIMPITNVNGLKRFSTICQAEIPRWLLKRLELYQDDEASLLSYGLDVVTRLCEQLIAEKVPGLHFYTLNKAHTSVEICRRLGGGQRLA